MESNGGSKLGYMVLGLSLGAIAGLVFAPRTGEETRKIIRDRADEGRDYLRSRADEMGAQAEDWLEKGKAKGKEWMAQGQDVVDDAFESGKQAYQENINTRKQ